jgi:hypothetical protein
MGGKAQLSGRHRAFYLLERGVWRARCRLCDWEVSDPVHRQATALFRQHIRAARVGEAKHATRVLPEHPA